MTLRPTKGKPGQFSDTIVIPEYYEEVEPRKFVHEFGIGEFREDDKYDTVRIYPSKKLITKWQRRRIWFAMRLGEILLETGEWIERIGMRLKGYTIDDLLPGEQDEQ